MADAGRDPATRTPPAASGRGEGPPWKGTPIMTDALMLLIAVAFLALCEALVHGFERLAQGGPR